MVGKSILTLVLSITILLAVQPWSVCIGGTRQFEIFTMDNPPPKDPNGNFTLDDEQWDITGEGFLDGNISMSGHSIINMYDANITINGTIWAKDNSEIIIRSSTLWLEVPSPELVLIEKQYEGPHGFLLTEDGASLTIKDSFIYLHRHDIELYQPKGWLVPSEVMVNFGDLYVDNSYINTSGSIYNATYDETTYTQRGVVVHMDCEFNINNSNLTSGIVFYVNSHGFINNTTLRSLSMFKNTEESIVYISNSTISEKTVTIDEVSRAIFHNCTLKSALIVKGQSEVFLHNTSIEGLKMHGSATLVMENSKLSVGPKYQDWGRVTDNSNLTLLNSSFIQELYFQGNSSVVINTSSMNLTFFYDDAFAFLKNGSIENLFLEDNSTVWLQGSTIERYDLKNDAKICNITTLSVNTKLNLQPLSIPVELWDSFGNTIITSETNRKGSTEFTLIRDMICINKTSMELTFRPLITYCIVVANHENLHKEEGVDIVGDFVEMELEFEDYNPPILGDASFKVDPFLNTNEKVLVSVHAEDSETNLANVSLWYSVDDGATWEKIMLYNTGQNIYENSIPGQSDGKKVRFYIIA